MSDNPYQAPEAPLGGALPDSDADYPFGPPRWGVIYALGANLLAAVASIVVLVAQADLFSAAVAAGGGLDPTAAEANDIRVGLVASVELISYLACIVLWGTWTVRAAKNIRSLEPEMRFEFTPRWTYIWFFVPFLNLVRPYQAAKEIFIFSAPENREGHPVNTSLVSAWWGLWILSNIVGQVLFRTTPDEAGSLQEMISYGWMNIGANVLTLVNGLVAIRMIMTINANQNAKRAPAPDSPGGVSLPPWARPR